MQNLSSLAAGNNHLFHPPSFNNFSIVLINKKKSAEKVKQFRESNFRHLNQASYSLQGYIHDCLQNSSIEKLIPADPLNELRILSKRWAQQIEKGNSFLTFEYAESLITYLQSCSCAVLNLLNSEKYRFISRSFVQIPFVCKSFSRLSYYSDADDFSEILLFLANAFTDNPDLFFYIERIEIARNDLSVSIGPKATQFPKFSIHFDPVIVNSSRNPVIYETFKLINSSNPSAFKQNHSIDFALSLSENITVSQGFNNYKRFLKILSVLDNVYNQASNYAFVV